MAQRQFALPIYSSMHKKASLLGGERKLVLFVTLIAVAIPLTSTNLPSLIFGVCLWVFGLPALRWMYQQDPQMSEVYLRSLRYRGYYAPRSRPARINRRMNNLKKYPRA